MTWLPSLVQMDVNDSGSASGADTTGTRNGIRPPGPASLSSSGAITSSTDAPSTNMVDGEKPVDTTRDTISAAALPVGASEPIPIKGECGFPGSIKSDSNRLYILWCALA